MNRHVHLPYARRALPRLAMVRQSLPGGYIADPRGEVRRRLLDFGLRDRVHSGHRIAITAGSRGMGGFLDLLAGAADAVRAAGGEPEIVPAMGSHGGATPEGQAEILRLLGVSDDTVGAPVRATMDTVTTGAAPNGAVAHLDRIASEADGIIVLGRVKTHPESATGLASGLLKMITAGLGKQRGAQQAHNHGLWESVRAVPRLVMARARILCGVAVVENGYRQPVAIEVAPPGYEAFLETDQRLLRTAREHLARIPFDDLDLLVVDQIGKTISGTGMDLNVIGAWRATGGPPQPNYRRIVALSLTPPSLGNALGVGMADFITERLMRACDPAVTYINLLTATEPGGATREGPLPLALHSDREAAEVGLYSSLAGEAPRLCRIRSTAELDRFWVSEAMLDEVRRNPGLTVESDPAPPAFDAAGNLF